jgi:hypothetical protein
MARYTGPKLELLVTLWSNIRDDKFLKKKLTQLDNTGWQKKEVKKSIQLMESKKSQIFYGI